MKLFLVGANSPTGKDLVEILKKRRISFLAPPRAQFFPDNAMGIAKLVTEYEPTQLINMADFISGNHGALRRAENNEDKCREVNTLLPATLGEICNHLNIPILHLSNAYVFDGEKRLGYNENDDTDPTGVYGQATLEGEQAVAVHHSHIILRSGWLFGAWKRGLIKTWIRMAKKQEGRLQLVERRFSPTYTGDLAGAILAICQQVDCGANVWGTYHYSGLETKREAEFVQQVLKYAANHDQEIYELLDRIDLIERDVRYPEIVNSTLSSKKLFDTFGIKQKSWHGHLKDVIKLQYDDEDRRAGKRASGAAERPDAA